MGKRCEIVHVFTYWLGGKISYFPDALCRDTTHFNYLDFHRNPLYWMISTDFFKEVLVGQWHIKDQCYSDSPQYKKLKSQLDRLKNDGITVCTDGSKRKVQIQLPKDAFGLKQYTTIIVKLFRIGVLSIVIRWQPLCQCSQAQLDMKILDAIAEIIKRPELTVRSIGNQLASRQQAHGQFNVEAAQCAQLVAALFGEDLKEISNSNNQKPKVSWFLSTGLNLLERDLTSPWIPGKSDYQYVNPYIGLVIPDNPLNMDTLNHVIDGGQVPKSELDKITLVCQRFITLATTNPPSFRRVFVSPIRHVVRENVARGNTIVLVDRRCTITSGLHVRGLGQGMPLLVTLLFSMECIFAAVESTRRFLAELDKRAPKENYSFNKYLAESGTDLTQLKENIKSFLNIISQARALSPCDEKIIQVESYVTAITVINAVRKMKELQLNNLTELVRNKMITFSRLLETGYNFVSSKNQETILKNLEGILSKLENILGQDVKISRQIAILQWSMLAIMIAMFLLTTARSCSYSQ